MITLYAIAALPLTAQALAPLGDPPRQAVALEFLKPALDVSGIAFPTTINRLDLRFQAGSAVVTAALPFSFAFVENAFGGSQESTLVGNIALGVDVSPSGTTIGSMDILLPTTSGGGDDDGAGATAFAIVGDYDDLERYLQDAITVRATIGRRWHKDRGLGGRIAGRFAGLVPTQGGGDPEVFFDYAGQLGYDGGSWTVGGVFSGRYLITEEDFLFGRNVLGFDAAAGVRIGTSFRPALLLHLPLDPDMADVIGPSVGLRLEFAFGAAVAAP